MGESSHSARSGAPAAGGRSWLVVAAHPDDEAIGASFVLQQAAEPSVLYITDGAPEDEALRPPAFHGSRDEYALVRRDEAASALATLGRAATLECLGLPDQRASDHLVAATYALVQRLLRWEPSVVVSHAYEGGHPDHDASAFMVRAALALLRRQGARRPTLLEMASYHGAYGRLQTGSFIVRRTEMTPEWMVLLSPEERATKRRMFGAYRSQSEVLAAFETNTERYRFGASADFTRPPHDGLLWYERLGWPMRGSRFCSLAALALRSLRLLPAELT